MAMQVRLRSARRNRAGFTLIELMIVVAIIAILAAIALPAYQGQIRKSRRADGQRALMDAAARQERFYFNYNTYTNVYKGGGSCTGQACGLNYGGTTSEDGYYNMSITLSGGGQGFTITADPAGTAQSGDPCGKLLIDEKGAKTYSGSGSSCW